MEELAIVGAMLIVIAIGGNAWLTWYEARRMTFPPGGEPVVRVVESTAWTEVPSSIMAVESTFPKGLRESRASLGTVTKLATTVFVTAELGGQIVGYACGGPLESFPEVRGLNTDLRYGFGDTFYVFSWVVLPSFQKRGIGKALRGKLLLVAKEKGFSYVAAHVRKGKAKSWGAVPRITCPNWSGTKETFEYFRRDLGFGDWTDGCRGMVQVQAVLAGLTAVILALIAAQPPKNILGPISLFFEVGAVVLFALSAEKSTDALERREIRTYGTAINLYNFGVMLMLGGLAVYIFQLSFGVAPSWSAPAPVAYRFVALALLAAVGYGWVWDVVWLLFPRRKVEWITKMEVGENV